MSYQQADTRVRPAATWYLVPVVMWLICIVLFVMFLKTVADLVTGDTTSVTNGASVQVPDDGLTFYATESTAERDCVLRNQSEQRFQLETFSEDLNLNPPSADSYYALGSTPEGLDGGTYTITCSGIEPAAELRAGSRIDIAAIGKSALWGLLLPVILGLAALIFLIVLLVRRHNSKSRIRSAQFQPPTGYGYGPPAS